MYCIFLCVLYISVCIVYFCVYCILLCVLYIAVCIVYCCVYCILLCVLYIAVCMYCTCDYICGLSVYEIHMTNTKLFLFFMCRIHFHEIGALPFKRINAVNLVNDYGAFCIE